MAIARDFAVCADSVFRVLEIVSENVFEIGTSHNKSSRLSTHLRPEAENIERS
jgi:hypothetical protein